MASGEGIQTVVHRDYRQGIRKPSGYVSIAAAATPQNLYLLTSTRSGVIRKIHIFNANAAPTRVQIGTGLAAAYAQALPDIPVPAGQDLELTEPEIVNVEFFVNITVQATAAAAAPNDVRMVIDVEEFEGTGA